MKIHQFEDEHPPFVHIYIPNTLRGYMRRKCSSGTLTSTSPVETSSSSLLLFGTFEILDDHEPGGSSNKSLIIHVYMSSPQQDDPILSSTNQSFIRGWKWTPEQDENEESNISMTIGFNVNHSPMELVPIGQFGQSFGMAKLRLASTTGSTVREPPFPWLVFDEVDGTLVQILLNDQPMDPGMAVLFEYNPWSISRLLQIKIRHLQLLQHAQSKEIQMDMGGLKIPNISGFPKSVLSSFLFEVTGLEDIVLKSHISTFTKSEIRTLNNPQPDEKAVTEEEAQGIESIMLRLKRRILTRSLAIRQGFHSMSLMRRVIQESCWITIGNLLFILMLDVFLGVVLSSYLSSIPDLFELLQEGIEKLLDFLLKILDWLRGAPAGLKLNDALNSLLWRFFSYHLHLWRNYIGVLEPVLGIILTAIVKAGFCGISLQIALTKDLLSISTFHVYCLYIYATRLFYIQLNSLKSLGRLFFGRKWNPLRKRIDSIQLSNSEMFLCSLGFTVAFFLVPTTFVYYVVFLFLRLPLLLVESLLTGMVSMFNSLKLLSAVLILKNSSLVANEIYIEPETSIGHLNGKEVPVFKILTLTTRSIITTPAIGPSLRDTLSKVVQGKVLTQF